ncbi:MAG: HEPN domain-containing protein [Sedimentisphaerales bacterium]|nr:HEPN domain-containing protein [Sedimentisphaerales bacterium]
MDPADFLKTADLLKTQSEQAHFRTSAGRSYYAAFLYFREYFKRLGLKKTKQPSKDAHAFVIQCLQFSKVDECVKAAQYLRDLQQVREDADYHLNREFSQSEAEDAFLKAKKVLSIYEEDMNTEKEKVFCNNAIAFAKLKDWM